MCWSRVCAGPDLLPSERPGAWWWWWWPSSQLRGWLRPPVQPGLRQRPRHTQSHQGNSGVLNREKTVSVNFVRKQTSPKTLDTGIPSVVDPKWSIPDPDPALNFRIRIQAKVPDPCGSGSNPCYLSIFGNCKQNHLKFNHKETSTYQVFAIFYFTLQSYSTQSPEFTEK